MHINLFIEMIISIFCLKHIQIVDLVAVIL